KPFSAGERCSHLLTDYRQPRLSQQSCPPPRYQTHQLPHTDLQHCRLPPEWLATVSRRDESINPTPAAQHLSRGAGPILAPSLLPLPVPSEILCDVLQKQHQHDNTASEKDCGLPSRDAPNRYSLDPVSGD